MYEYVHGGNFNSTILPYETYKIIDFSANINPFGLPEKVKQAIVNSISECEKYPDPFCRELTVSLANYEQLDKNFLFCSNGASDIIFRLAIAVKPKKALLLAPTFSDYEKALSTVNCEISYYYLKEENNFKIDVDFLDKIDDSIDLVIICNPNNPTGGACDKIFLKKALEKCKKTNALLFVDECFNGFLEFPFDYSVKEYIDFYDNLIILKAFTKIFAMAGIRLGYAITSNTMLIEKLRLCGQDWSVSSIAQAAGVAALKETQNIAKTVLYIKNERKLMIERLSSLGAKVFGSKANYIFFKVVDEPCLKGKLLLKGFLIRSCSNYVSLNQEYYRVAVKLREDNLKLLQAVEEVLN
jgi:threonine-phosphate decarboxylase